MRNRRALWLACLIFLLIIAGLVALILTSQNNSTPSMMGRAPAGPHTARTHLLTQQQMTIGSHSKYHGHEFNFTIPPGSSQTTASDDGSTEVVTLRVNAITVLLISQGLTTTISLQAYAEENDGRSGQRVKVAGYPGYRFESTGPENYLGSLLTIHRERLYRITVSAPHADRAKARELLRKLQTSFTAVKSGY